MSITDEEIVRAASSLGVIAGGGTGAAAWAAADAAPADFAVTERATESPVPRSSILLGTRQLLG